MARKLRAEPGQAAHLCAIVPVGPGAKRGRPVSAELLLLSWPERRGRRERGRPHALQAGCWSADHRFRAHFQRRCPRELPGVGFRRRQNPLACGLRFPHSEFPDHLRTRRLPIPADQQWRRSVRMGPSASPMKRIKNALQFALRALISAAFADAPVAQPGVLGLVGIGCHSVRQYLDRSLGG
jgi:hypothetical protein